jgi:hypothetical protein
MAQDDCFNLVARRYPDLMAEEITLTVDSTGVFTLPEDAFEQRLTRVYRKKDSYSEDLERVNYRDKQRFESKVGSPTHYAILKNKGYILPSPESTDYTFIAAYLQDVPPIVQEQGRVTAFTAASFPDPEVPSTWVNATITIADRGSLITSDSSDLNRFVNIIDGQSGLIKATLEIKDISTAGSLSIIEFKTTPTRAKVYNRTVSNDIPTDLEEDDYICTADGSCVLFFKKPASNYIIQHATTEIKRSLGMDAQLEEMALSRYEENLKGMNSGRENSAKVTKRRNRLNRRY